MSNIEKLQPDIGGDDSDIDDSPVFIENEKGSTRERNTESKRNSPKQENVLKFSDLKMIIKKKDKKLINDCFGSIHSGHVVAIMGPSGAGKTTLLRALTLESFAGGEPIGSVTLNGKPLTERLFRKNCYVVKQQDNHWQHLTCREVLLYAAELYEVVEKAKLTEVVDDIISRMGLYKCKDTKCIALSGGQQRRLSVSVALLKKPTILFLDEPTTGLDAKSASVCMKEICSLAKDENLIVLCTIHQPSSRVFHGFDQLMLMSKGRQAFVGDVTKAQSYFESIGHVVPEDANPADFYLDLVNADFSSSKEVEKILDTWKERREIDDTESEKEIIDLFTDKSSINNILVLCHRHAKLMVRDPILYRGRSIMFFFTNLYFALIYLKARPFEQAEVMNKVFANLWLIGIPSCMGVVGVYGVNLECKAIIAEAKNGMIKPSGYVITKSILVLPWIVVSAVTSMGIAGWAIQGYFWSASVIGSVMGVWSAYLFFFECLGEACAILFDNPIFGMLIFVGFWFAAFLFGGFILPVEAMVWPFKIFYYIFPMHYTFRSMNYALFIDATWDSCTDPTQSAVCTPSTSGADVLDALGGIYPLFSSENTVAADIAVAFGLSLLWKLVFVALVIFKAKKVANIVPS